MRGGRVVERVELATEPGDLASRDAEVLQAALQQFYEERVAPTEISLPLEIEDADAIEAWLSARAGRKVRMAVPSRGDKRALVELATRNAELSYRTRFNEATAAHFDALETLRVSLGLPTLPRRIECFDISNLQGGDSVAALVTWEGGKPLTGKEPEIYDWEGWELVGPSAVPHTPGSPTPRAFTNQEVKDMVVKWGDAAARAHQAGFDLLEIHAAHGYLLHQFLSPVSNVRNDESAI